MDQSIAPFTGRPNPARVYLASLAPGGRRSAAYQLRQAARILTGHSDIDAVPWQHLDRTAVIGILETLRRQGKASSTINHCLSILKRVAEESWQCQSMEQETYLRISRVKTLSGSRLPAGRAPSREEVRQAIEQARAGSTLRHLRDAALLATLAGAGLRCFELRTLQRDDYQGGRLRLHGKGNKQALQPLAPAGREILEEYLDALPAGAAPLFVRWRRYDTPGTTALSASGVDAVVKTWCPTLSPHDLRRAYATWLAEVGHGLPVVQRLMRHANPATTMRYIRNEEEVIEANESLRF